MPFGNRADETTARITGDLSIRGINKPVIFDMEHTGSAKDPYGNLRLGFEVSVVINRKAGASPTAGR